MLGVNIVKRICSFPANRVALSSFLDSVLLLGFQGRDNDKPLRTKRLCKNESSTGRKISKSK